VTQLEQFQDWFEKTTLLSRIELAMEEVLLERGSCSVEDGYAILNASELAFAKAHQLGHIAVRRLREARGLRKFGVENSSAPSRKGGYVARWTR